MLKFKKYCVLLVMLIPLVVYAKQYAYDVQFYDYNQYDSWYSGRNNWVEGYRYYDVSVDVDNYSVSADTAKITNGKILDVKSQQLRHSYRVPSVGWVENNNGLITVTTNSSRSSSEDVVDWVKAQLNASGVRWKAVNMTANTYSDTKPKKLDFAVKVDLIISSASEDFYRKHICRNVIIAQGYNIHENWWIFSNMDNSASDDTSSVRLKCEGGDIQVSAVHSSRIKLIMQEEK